MRSDAERNCVSNIRPEGLGYDAAATRIAWLMREARRLERTGIGLKDRSDRLEVADRSTSQNRRGMPPRSFSLRK